MIWKSVSVLNYQYNLIVLFITNEQSIRLSYQPSQALGFNKIGGRRDEHNPPAAN